MRMNTIAVGLMLALAHPANAEPAPMLTGFSVSGGMTPNADGTASFEFRVANDRADATVTGFTVTVAFYDREVAPGRKLAEYRWSFLSEVPPNGQLLEYGVLGKKPVADLVKRHAIAAGQAKADPLATAVYTYAAKIDAQAAAPKN
jgi:hypothetical protein